MAADPLVSYHMAGPQLGFPGQRDRSLFIAPGLRDNGTEVPSLSRDKGTMGQAQNLAVGQDGPGQPVKIRYGTRDWTITIFLSKSGTGQGPGRDGTITIFEHLLLFLECPFPVFERPFLF